MSEGWIKLHRKMLEWGWYSDPATKCVFLHLLLLANYGEREFMGREIHPGQAVITYAGVAKALGLSVKNVRTALAHLEKTHEIGREVAGKWQLVTIEKWGFYQLSEEGAGTETAGKWQGSGNLLAGNRQHYKKERKEEGKNYSCSTIDRIRANERPPGLTEKAERLTEMRAQLRKANEEEQE